MLEQIIYSIKLFQPETVLIATFCVAIISELFVKSNRHTVGVIVFLGLLVTGWYLTLQESMAAASVFSNMYAVDPFSLFFKCIILLSSLLIVAFSFNSNELHSGKLRVGEYYALLVSMTLGMFLMSSASNLIMMYLSIELTSLSSYILAGYTKEAKDSSEASLKYVIYGALSSGMMLYGISLLYGLTGSVDVYGINRALHGNDINVVALMIAGILTIVGFGYKISAVPFHFWTPDVYEGAPITITAFLSVASKAAGFAMMIRFFTMTFVESTVSLSEGVWTIIAGFDWNQIIAWLSVVTMTVGNLVALWQSNLKRLLAYSSIAHAGYMLMGVVVLSSEGIAAVLIYFGVYLFMNLGAFYLVMLVANKTGTEDIESYKGLGYRTPLIGVAMTIFLLSLTGIPPTAGFIGKLYLFAALINAKWFWLAIIGALNSVVSLYYYVKVLRNMFLVEPTESQGAISFSVSQVVLLFVLLLPTLLFGLYFSPLVEFAHASVKMFTP
jgi:NADH-quinone oxidoreductase subunit N